MEARVVDKNLYEVVCKNITNIYNRVEFNEINRSKVDNIIYIIFYHNNSPRFCATFGEINNEWFFPFSAPFGYIEQIKKEQSINRFEEVLSSLELLASDYGCHKVNITMPPAFYDDNIINVWYALMLNRGWKVDYVDINFSFDLKKISNDYINKIYYNAKKNIKIAQKKGLVIRECRTKKEMQISYGIIKKNRDHRGYPLRMSERQVFETINVVPAKMYIIGDALNDLAAAMVYEVTADIAQVIYWGELPGADDKRVMNMLSYELIKIYYSRGFLYLDIGPSTENGIVNYGLCNFKDSIGCDRTSKFTLHKEIDA